MYYLPNVNNTLLKVKYSRIKLIFQMIKKASQYPGRPLIISPLYGSIQIGLRSQP